MFDELLAIGEAAKRLGVSQDTLRNWEENGKLVPERTAGGHRRYRLSDLKLLQLAENTSGYTDAFQKVIDDPAAPARLRHLARLHVKSYEELTRSLVSRSADNDDYLPARNVPVGIPDIDRALGGAARAGWVGMIGGPSPSFKSTLALQLAVAKAQAGQRVVVFALDTDAEKTQERLVSQMTGLLAGRALNDDVLQDVRSRLLVLDDPADPNDDERRSLTPNWIKALVQAAVVEHFDGEPVDLVVVDGLPHLTPDSRWKGHRGSLVMGELHQLARALDALLLVTASTAKSNDPFPAGSAAQLDYCDFVLLLERPEANELNVHLWKNRYGGTVDLELQVDMRTFLVSSRG